jgi:hypothetical protein
VWIESKALVLQCNVPTAMQKRTSSSELCLHHTHSGCLVKYIKKAYMLSMRRPYWIEKIIKGDVSAKMGNESDFEVTRMNCLQFHQFVIDN